MIKEMLDKKLPCSKFIAGRGVYVVGFSYPVVPHGKARIRVQISAAHTEEDIDYCVDAFVAIGRELKLVP